MGRFKYILSTLFMCTLATSASATNLDARISYQTQTCHQSTAPIIKRALEKASQLETHFCNCVAEQAIKNNPKVDDHAYALAYHEINIALERTGRYNQPSKEIFQEMSKRVTDYENDYDVKFKTLIELTQPALESVLSCKDRTIPQIRNRFRR